MSTMITGSVAYDTILTHNGRFADKLEKGDLRHVNLTFSPRKCIGTSDCAANIAYAPPSARGRSLRLERPRARRRRLSRALPRARHPHGRHALPCGLLHVAGLHRDRRRRLSARKFHPGAMDASDRLSWPEDRSIDYALLGPGGVRPMKLHAKLFQERGVPYLFDPGQAGPLFTPEELRNFADGADACAFSDFEAEYLEKVAGLTPEGLSQAARPYTTPTVKRARPYGSRAEKGSKSRLSPRRPSTPWEQATPIGAAFSSRANGVFLRSSGPASAPFSEASRWRCAVRRTGARPWTKSAASTHRTGEKRPSERLPSAAKQKPPSRAAFSCRCGRAIRRGSDRRRAAG